MVVLRCGRTSLGRGGVLSDKRTVVSYVSVSEGRYWYDTSPCIRGGICLHLVEAESDAFGSVSELLYLVVNKRQIQYLLH